MSLGKITKFPNFTNLLKFFIQRNKVYGILPFPPRGSAKPASSLCSRSAAKNREFFGNNI